MSLNVRFIRGQWTSLTRPYRMSRRAWIETGILDLVAGFVLAAVYFLPFSNKSAGFTIALAVGILISCGLIDLLVMVPKNGAIQQGQTIDESHASSVQKAEISRLVAQQGNDPLYYMHNASLPFVCWCLFFYVVDLGTQWFESCVFFSIATFIGIAVSVSYYSVLEPRWEEFQTADRKKKARMLAPSLTMGIVLGAVVAVGLCAFAWWAIHAHLTL